MSDFYTRVVSAALGISEEAVTREQRDAAKNACFAQAHSIEISPLASKFDRCVEIARKALK